MSAKTTLQKRAQAAYRGLERKQKDPRFQRAMARFVSAGLLQSTYDMAPGATERAKVPLEDVLWAGEVEPRLLELLPAVLVKRPSLLRVREALPDDLAAVVHAIRHQKPAPVFRGVPPAKYLPWVSRIGRRDRAPSVLKSFRFTAADVERIRRLHSRIGAASETDVVRLALEVLEANTKTGITGEPR